MITYPSYITWNHFDLSYEYKYSNIIQTPKTTAGTSALEMLSSTVRLCSYQPAASSFSAKKSLLLEVNQAKWATNKCQNIQHHLQTYVHAYTHTSTVQQRVSTGAHSAPFSSLMSNPDGNIGKNSYPFLPVLKNSRKAHNRV